MTVRDLANASDVCFRLMLSPLLLMDDPQRIQGRSRQIKKGTLQPNRPKLSPPDDYLVPPHALAIVIGHGSGEPA